MEYVRQAGDMAKAFALATVVSVKMTVSEFSRRKENYLLGVLTVILVVFMISVILTGVDKSPVIFLKLAEEQTGEMDMLFIRNNIRSGDIPFLNFTAANISLAAQNVSNGPDLKAMVPRWLITADASKKWPSSDTERNTTVDVTLLIVDSKEENKINMGRKWGHRRIGESECHVKDTVLRLLGIEANVGEHIILEISIDRFLQDQNINSDQLLNLFGGSGSTTNTSTDLIIDALGLNNNDNVEVNVTVVTEGISDLFNITIPAPAPGDELQNVTVQNARDIIPGVLSNGSINGTSIDLLSLLNNGTIRLDLDVVDEVDGAGGKYPNAVGNAVIIDSTYFLHTMLEQLCYETQRRLIEQVTGTTIPDAQEVVDNFEINDVALTMIALFNSRQDTYTLPKPSLDKDVVKKSDAVMRALDVRYNATISFPLALAMDGFYFLRLFLEQIFNAVIVTLAVLGCILIYSLLLSNVEEKTFEHGMLRALGFRKLSLINLITIQAMSFTIPGVAIAMTLAVIANIIIEVIVSDFSGFDAQTDNMPLLAIVIPIVVGVSVPLFANIWPIQRAMQKTLRGALDVSHQAHTETTVTVQKLQDLGLALWQTLLAIFLVVAGFIVYYLMPYSFIFNDLPLFFFLLLIILMGMLFGLCMISAALQSPLELGVLRAILWGKDKILKTLIEKNLSGHRNRSSKTYMMFTISTASIIFGGVVFTLQANSIEANIEVLVGTDVQVWSTDFDFPINRDLVDPYMREQVATSDVVLDWSYTSFALNDYDQFRTTAVSNLLFFPSANQRPTGVDRNLQNVIYDKYFLPVDTQSGVSKSDIFSSLYTLPTEGSNYRPVPMHSGVPPGETVPDLGRKYSEIIEVVASAGSKDFMSLRSENAMKLEVEYRTSRTATTEKEADYLAQPRSLISKMPGYPFVISSYTFGLGSAPIFMSMDSFQTIINDNTVNAWRLNGSSTSRVDLTKIYHEKMFIRLKDGVTTFEREAFINELKSYLSREYHTVLDVSDLKDTTRMAIDLLLLFFYMISGIAVALNLFLLWMSFSTNVKQSAWSFAVMRSLGFNVDQLIKAYVYEALCTVLSAFFCGCVIGLIIAITLTVQFNMFVEMPMDFTFPYVLFIVVFCEALFTAIVGSYVPALELRKKQIAQVLKSQ
eukprot:TRINITY_DN1840_c3_g1_i1.p1 TRINITY_DN1840_c3_g1~~TRINITY_DN1840_c3_g1_i1.p1  ORF type:complete len:1156 (+),score=159.94 TRINITY_DN1840_c3_g1_i1:26-3469(+)